MPTATARAMRLWYAYVCLSATHDLPTIPTRCTQRSITRVSSPFRTSGKFRVCRRVQTYTPRDAVFLDWRRRHGNVPWGCLPSCAGGCCVNTPILRFTAAFRSLSRCVTVATVGVVAYDFFLCYLNYHWPWRLLKVALEGRRYRPSRREKTPFRVSSAIVTSAQGLVPASSSTSSFASVADLAPDTAITSDTTLASFDIIVTG